MGWSGLAGWRLHFRIVVRQQPVAEPAVFLVDIIRPVREQALLAVAVLQRDGRQQVGFRLGHETAPSVWRMLNKKRPGLR